VLHQVSTQMKTGELVGLLGRNGVGKSTFLKSVIGLVSSRHGSITVLGIETIGLRPFQIARMGVGFVPEDRRVFGDLTVRENLWMGLRLSNVHSRSDWNIDRVFMLFPRLRERDRSRGGFLSGGEQQMLSIARTLVGNPILLLLDEPMEGLAPLVVANLEQSIKEIHKSGVGVLLVDRNREVMEALAEEVMVMCKGEIVESGKTSSVLDDSEVCSKYLAV
jgi:branched-chain amino acid transport system ATP-binding protein